MKSAARKFQVPLPEEVYNALLSEAELSSTPATTLAREAIEVFLRRRRSIALHEAIATYAAQHAGTRTDLDPELEDAAVELLLE